MIKAVDMNIKYCVPVNNALILRLLLRVGTLESSKLSFVIQPVTFCFYLIDYFF